MDADHERILTLVAAALLGALLGGPAVALIRGLLKAVGQLAAVTLLAVAIFFLMQHGWPPSWSDSNTSLPGPTGTSVGGQPNAPPPGPWWRSREETAR
jgi:hypothetical protein